MSTNVISVPDYLGTKQNFAAEITLQGVITPHTVPEVGGLPVGPLNPMPMADAAVLAALAALAPITGGSTAAGQATANGLLNAIGTLLANQDTAALQTIANTALAAILAGQSTAALQTTGNTALAALVAAPRAALNQDGGSLVHLVNGAASGPGADASGASPAALTTLATFMVVNPGQYRVQNQSAAPIQVRLSDGASGAVSVIILGPGSTSAGYAANTQGGDTSPELPWFTGQIVVSGAPGAQFFARHN